MPHSAKLGLLLLLCGSATLPQRLISARAGTVNYSRGASFIDGQRVILFRNKLLVLKKGETLQTRVGRIEVLLGEGVFLRMGDASSIRMDENRYADTRVAIETGFALIEVAHIAKDARLHITCGDLTTEVKALGTTASTPIPAVSASTAANSPWTAESRRRRSAKSSASPALPR